MYTSLARLPLYIRIWFMGAFVISLLSIGMYATAHQIVHQGGSDPQIQIAEDTAAALSATGLLPATTTPINMLTSLTPFITIYDAKGNILQAGGVLENRVPALPHGVLAEASLRGEERFTWEPLENVLYAGVVVPYTNASSSGYVLATRSLRVVEERERSLFIMVATTWLLLLLGSFGLALVFFDSKGRKHSTSQVH